ncbi:MAG TPA: hypothetical protein VK899_01090, partial [Gemmatimonadales bacterium]|nr:hypothetical protein [Gemmatimonadales bacterium]
MPPAPANHGDRSPKAGHPDPAGDGEGDDVPEGDPDAEPDGLGDGLAVGDPVAGLPWAATARLMAACRS